MTVDLTKLQEMHPRLPADLAVLMVARAALGLERGGHASGVMLSLEIAKLQSTRPLAWPPAHLSVLAQHDHDQITEEGAEAISLAVAHLERGWRVMRRMQRREHGDWLLVDQTQGRGQRIALEVSGVARGPTARRLREKLAQVAAAEEVDQRWAGVVGFEAPRATLQSAGEKQRGH